MNRRTDLQGGASARTAARDMPTDTGELRRDSILIEPTPIGYLCVGFGDAARTLRFAFEDGADADDAFGDTLSLAMAMVSREALPTRLVGSGRRLAKDTDADLSRLAAIASLAKAGGYNPDEPRDEHGRWTTGGSTESEESSFHERIAAVLSAAARAVTQARDIGSAAEQAAVRRTRSLAAASRNIAGDIGAAANDVGSNVVRMGTRTLQSAVDSVGELEPALIQTGENAARFAERAAEAAADDVGAVLPKLRVLPALLPELASGALTAAAILVTPTNASNQSSGDLPFRPGLAWSSDEGLLVISQLDANGKREKIFSGFEGPDGYRSLDGVFLGRRVGVAGFAPDLPGVITLSARTDKKNDGRTREDYLKPEFMADVDAARTDDDDPNPRCPLPTPENIKGRSERSLLYQEWISGIPRGWDFNIFGVRFDGCIELKRLTLEAKAWAYARFIKSETEAQPWYSKLDAMMSQGARQSYADEAIGFTGEWDFAEEVPAIYFKERFSIFPNLRVRWRKFQAEGA